LIENIVSDITKAFFPTETNSLKRRENAMDNEPFQPSEASNWVDLHSDYLFAYACSRVHDKTTAEDLVQETFLAALQATDPYAGRSSVRT
jgi:RNA polymerase sigma-70 factor (ECF subfamily)